MEAAKTTDEEQTRWCVSILNTLKGQIDPSTCQSLVIKQKNKIFMLLKFQTNKQTALQSNKISTKRLVAISVSLKHQELWLKDPYEALKNLT